jgi:hypothetical protein
VASCCSVLHSDQLTASRHTHIAAPGVSLRDLEPTARALFDVYLGSGGGYACVLIKLLCLLFCRVRAFVRSCVVRSGSSSELWQLRTSHDVQVRSAAFLSLSLLPRCTVIVPVSCLAQSALAVMLAAAGFVGGATTTSTCVLAPCFSPRWLIVEPSSAC